jgi:hypothetical protein
MRPADGPAPPPTAPAALLDDATAAAALQLVVRYARQRWWAEGGTPDLAAYADAACSALTACLAHYDRARGVPFLQYARPRMWGAVRAAWQSYRAWRALRTRGPYAQATPHAHTLRPHVPALTAPVELAQVLRQLPTVAQQSAVLALQGHAPRACATPLGLGGHARGTALRRQWWGAFRQEGA